MQMIPRATRLFISAALLALGPCATLSAHLDVAANATQVSASDPHFVYEGRFDTSNVAGPVVIWQASRIQLDFESDSIALKFDDVKGQVFFNAEIDGRNHVLALR